jgi:hypothetical protein
MTPSLVGSAGIVGGRLYGPHDGARRPHALVTVPYQNIASVPAGSASTGPDGSSRGVTGNTFVVLYSAGGLTLSAGDRYFFGAWVKKVGATANYFVINRTNFTTTLDSNNGTYGVDRGAILGLQQTADHGWYFHHQMLKVLTVSGGAGAQTLSWWHYSGSTDVVCYPVCFKVPVAAGFSDNDAMEMLYHMCSIPTGPVADTYALQRGQRLAFYDATLATWKYLDIDNGTVRIT